MSQRHVMDYTDDETLVEALHRPPAVGVWQPRRAFLLLALLPLLAAILNLSLAVGALGVAVRPDAAPLLPALCLDRTYSSSLHAAGFCCCIGGRCGGDASAVFCCCVGGGCGGDCWNRLSALLPINCQLFCRSTVGDEHRR
jgi:hypothetical protein